LIKEIQKIIKLENLVNLFKKAIDKKIGAN